MGEDLHHPAPPFDAAGRRALPLGHSCLGARSVRPGPIPARGGALSARAAFPPGLGGVEHGRCDAGGLRGRRRPANRLEPAWRCGGGPAAGCVGRARNTHGHARRPSQCVVGNAGGLVLRGRDPGGAAAGGTGWRRRANGRWRPAGRHRCVDGIRAGLGRTGRLRDAPAVRPCTGPAAVGRRGGQPGTGAPAGTAAHGRGPCLGRGAAGVAEPGLGPQRSTTASAKPHRRASRRPGGRGGAGPPGPSPV